MTLCYWDYSEGIGKAKWVKKGNIMSFHFVPSMSGTNWLDVAYFNGTTDRITIKDFQSFMLDSIDSL